ncbi:toxin glutamine deamidase domain-containing protein [Nonomuraea sp. NPDC049655]|uniref:toxin glutamine deamidase domain-containing protein n=1 Tax=Nonomuraea sp. NPDC049655 TaxID=3364355 RepID=UPI00379A1E06
MVRERKSSVRGVLPEGQYNPVVGEGVRWLDYERAAEDVPGEAPATTEVPSSREGSAPLTPAASSAPDEEPPPPPGLRTQAPPPSRPSPQPAAAPAPGVASALDVLTGLATRPAPARAGTPYGLTFSLNTLSRLALPDEREDARPGLPPTDVPDGPAPPSTEPTGCDADAGAATDGQTATEVPNAGETPTGTSGHREGRPDAPDAQELPEEAAGRDMGGPPGAGPDVREPGEFPGGGTGGPERPGGGVTRGFGAAVSGMRRLEFGERDGACGADGRHPLEARIDRARNRAAVDWFEGERRPPRLADSRPYGLPGGLAQPDPQVERELRQALELGTRFPDPRGTWVRLINGGGPADDPFRASNAADCALAVLSTWHGEPATAAPRLPEYDGIGRPLLTGEKGGAARIERWTGQRFQYAGQGRHAYPMIARRLLEAGHGASAVIVVRWPGGGSHVWNAVNSGSEVIWIDAQRGHMSVEPPYATVTGVFCMILDRQGRPR